MGTCGGRQGGGGGRHGKWGKRKRKKEKHMKRNVTVHEMKNECKIK